jgi:hypothetical protein
MSSVRRINASLASGALSHGPVTPEGKVRSAVNATHHALLARAATLGTENKEAFQAVVDAFNLRFQPVDPVKESLVEEMAVATWRTRRCWAMETRLVSDLAANGAAPGGVARLSAAYCELAASPGLPLINNLLQLQQNHKLPNEPNPIFEHPSERDPMSEPQQEPEPEPQLSPTCEASPSPTSSASELIPPISLGPHNLIQLQQNHKLPNEPNPISEHHSERDPVSEPQQEPEPKPRTATLPNARSPATPAPSVPDLIPPIPLGPPVPLPDPTDDPSSNTSRT